MLGRLKMTLAEVQKAYLEFAGTVFTPKHHKMNPTRAYEKLKASGKYQSEPLEEYIKKLLTDRGLPQDELLKDPNLDPDNCKVLVILTQIYSKLISADSSPPSGLRIYLQLPFCGLTEVFGLI